MSINVNDKNLGHATAYAYYKAGGGTMTEAEFTEFMADFGTASQTAVEAAQAALASKNAAQTAATTATNKASEATTAATTATTKAGEASTSASTATSAKDTAVSASQTATSKATEATTAAATATSAKTDAVAANTAAQSAKTAAQTAQTGAETAAASVQASAAQIATNASDISQLKSEFTAVNTELTDLRVGADGKTYGSAGSAVRGQISDLKSAFDSSFNFGKNRADQTKFENGYLNTSGVPTTNTDWVTTGFIYVHDLTDVYSSSRVISSSVRNGAALYYLCTYDANKDLIEQVYTNTTEVHYEVGAGVYYIRYSFHSDLYDQIQLEGGTVRTSYVPFTYALKDISLPNDTKFITDNYKPILETIDDALTNTQLTDITSEFTMSLGYIDNSNGNFIAYPSAESTDYICLYEYRDLYITGRPAFSSNCLYAIYDKDKKYLGYHRKDGLTETDFHVTLYDILGDYPTAFYIRYSSITTYQNLVIKRPANLQDIIQGANNGKWYGKKWVCIGDSLTEENSRTDKHYFDYVSDVTGITVVNLGSSGRGYKNPSSVDSKTYDDVVSEVPTDADVVTIFGSGNDLTHGYTLGDVTDTGTTTICGCINETLDDLIDRFPTVQLGVVAPTPWVNFPPYTANNAMELYVNALKTICANRSIPFLDLYHCSNLRPWTAEGRSACYSKDDGNGVHPDEEGHKLIAPRFNGFLDTLLI